MKAVYYVSAGASVGPDSFRFVGEGRVEADGRTLVFDGYQTQHSTEYKARVELDFEEALALIERLKAVVAKTPCPTCRRT